MEDGSKYPKTKLFKTNEVALYLKMVNGVRRHGTTIVKSLMPWEERSLWKNWKNGCKLDTHRVFIGKKKAEEAKMKTIENNIQTICRISKKKKQKKMKQEKKTF